MSAKLDKGKGQTVVIAGKGKLARIIDVWDFHKHTRERVEFVISQNSCTFIHTHVTFTRMRTGVLCT